MNINTLNAVYFIGIGGIGMSALARFFLSKGKKVGGYDRTRTELTEKLEEEGAEVILPDFMGFIKFMLTHKITFNSLLKVSKTKAKISKMAIKIVDILDCN